MANSNITNPCSCPDGFTYDPITDQCIKEETINPIYPVTPLYTGTYFDTNLQEGIISYGSLNNYVWPLITTPQDTTSNQVFSLAAMTAIPTSGTNSITGDSWTNISPPAQPGGQHAGIFSPPIPIPYPNPNPYSVPSPPPFNVLRPYSTSTILGGTLNYGQGPYAPITNFSSAPFFQNWYDSVAVWAYSLIPQIEYKWVGFLACIEPEVETTYQIIMTCNNGLRIIIDDNLAVESLTGDAGTQALVFVNHFEITLSPGLHIIRVENYNYSGNGGLACDILECSAAQLYAVTSDAQLDPYRVFSSSWKKERGINFTANGTNIITTVQTTKSYDVGACFDAVGVSANIIVIAVLGPNTYQLSASISAGIYNGYIRFLYDVSNIPENTFSCPSGFTLTSCNGLACIKTLEQPCQEPAYYTLNDCCTKEPLKFDDTYTYVLQYNGGCQPGLCPQDLQSVIITTIVTDLDPSTTIGGCYELTQIYDLPVESFIDDYNIVINSVETVPTCADCQVCPTDYQLTDCSDSTNIAYTCSDLSQYLGSVIKLENCGDTCWIVTAVPVSINPKPVGNITDVKLNCEDCLPQPEPVIPKAKPRTIRPGYFIKNPCLTTEYVEKVNCTFSNQVYNQMISVRYGVSSCCETDVNKWDIKKQIVDFELITIPKEEVHTPRTCYCYTITVTTGTANFKYINCEGDWCKVTLTENTANVCSQNKPQADCVELGVIYEITSSTTECETNDDCEQN